MATLLTICQKAAVRAGYPKPLIVIASTDPRIRQMAGLADEEGRELMRRHAWQQLRKEKTFTSAATEIQEALPDDFDRFVEGTFWNRTQTRLAKGPFTPIEWARAKGSVTTVFLDQYTVRENSIRMYPDPTAGETFAYEYMSKYWAGNLTLEAFGADTDDSCFPSQCMVLGTAWRFLQATGQDYAELLRLYQLCVADEISRDGGRPRLRMTGPRYAYGVSVPEGNWL